MWHEIRICVNNHIDRPFLGWSTPNLVLQVSIEHPNQYSNLVHPLCCYCPPLFLFPTLQTSQRELCHHITCSRHNFSLFICASGFICSKIDLFLFFLAVQVFSGLFSNIKVQNHQYSYCTSNPTFTSIQRHRENRCFVGIDRSQHLNIFLQVFIFTYQVLVYSLYPDHCFSYFCELI